MLGGAADVLALQRSAGNAAVARAVEAQRQGHAHGTTGPVLPVQRVSGTRAPGSLDNPREYGPGKMKAFREKDQKHLEKVFPREADGTFQKFPDPIAPATELVGGLLKQLKKIVPGSDAGQGSASDLEAAAWVKALNSRRGKGDDAYRRNCIDAARSFVASWSGNPTVAAGVHNTGPRDVESGGNQTAAAMLGGSFGGVEAPPGTQVQGEWGVVAARLAQAGHGACSIVVFRREETNLVHAVNGVNHNGRIVWVDPQMGLVSSQPMYNGDLFQTITIDSLFRQVDAPAASTTALQIPTRDQL
ncbi:MULTISPECIES: toxin glutamine deamidase domain-containing protein [Streptomyces]|uniref:Tox-PL domain-containing protein n=1 Tax=Streptomyces lycii TaxID=2654337 RepID=A0ABQ7FDE9_9ACTN|nr:MULTISPECIES: toxin glutamine deamidase domain-containing protein [Streptomyces]KAF4407086.1 hypothetical protein GCU69_21415 [Streptomyces lycii]